jgi:hypothetical protein
MLVWRQKPHLFRLLDRLPAWLVERNHGILCLAGRCDDLYSPPRVFWKSRQIQKFVSGPVFSQNAIGDQLVKIYRGGRKFDEFQKLPIVPVGHPFRARLNRRRSVRTQPLSWRGRLEHIKG